jgi:peptidyl-tRNA hydrolase
MKIKMYCVVAKESVQKMNGIRGKMCTQAGHAYLHSYWNSVDNFADHAKAYRDTSHAYKITLVVDTVEQLKTLQEAYKNVCGTSLVTDAAFTVFDEPTTTCLGIGPIPEDLIGEDLKSLKTFT